MTRHSVARTDEDITVRHISQVLPSVLAKYLHGDESRRSNVGQPVQLKLFDDVMSSVHRTQGSTVAG